MKVLPRLKTGKLLDDSAQLRRDVLNVLLSMLSAAMALPFHILWISGEGAGSFSAAVDWNERLPRTRSPNCNNRHPVALATPANHQRCPECLTVRGPDLRTSVGAWYQSTLPKHERSELELTLGRNGQSRKACSM